MAIDESTLAKRQHPRFEIQLPVMAQLDDESTLVLQTMDISAQGMQLRMRGSDIKALQKSLQKVSNPEDQNQPFEICLKARLTWIQRDGEGTYKTGWEFHSMDLEEKIE